MVNQKRIYYNKGYVIYGVQNPILHFLLKLFPQGLIKPRDCNKCVLRRDLQCIKIHEIFRNADSSSLIFLSWWTIVAIVGRPMVQQSIYTYFLFTWYGMYILCTYMIFIKHCTPSKNMYKCKYIKQRAW